VVGVALGYHRVEHRLEIESGKEAARDKKPESDQEKFAPSGSPVRDERDHEEQESDRRDGFPKDPAVIGELTAQDRERPRRCL